MLESASWTGILTSAGAALITHGTWQQSTQALNVVFCSNLQRYSEDAQLFTLYCTENKESTSRTCLDRPAYYQDPEILLASNVLMNSLYPVFEDFIQLAWNSGVQSFWKQSQFVTEVHICPNLPSSAWISIHSLTVGWDAPPQNPSPFWGVILLPI